MAKRHAPDAPPADTAEDLPPVADAVPLKKWVVSTKDGGITREVHADTLEDAIRAFNGTQTAYPRKQLDIVEG